MSKMGTIYEYKPIRTWKYYTDWNHTWHLQMMRDWNIAITDPKAIVILQGVHTYKHYDQGPEGACQPLHHLLIMAQQTITQMFYNLGGYESDSTKSQYPDYISVDDAQNTYISFAVNEVNKLCFTEHTVSYDPVADTTGDVYDDRIIAHRALSFADMEYDKVRVDPDTGKDSEPPFKHLQHPDPQRLWRDEQTGQAGVPRSCSR